MSIISHTIVLDILTVKDNIKLKQLCQDWTRIDDTWYVLHHSNLLINSCPLCKLEVKDDTPFNHSP